MMLKIFENKATGGKGNPADLDYVFRAFLNEAISIAEIIEWTERVIRDTDYLLPEIIYDVAAMNKKTATRDQVRDEFERFRTRADTSKDMDGVLRRIGYAREKSLFTRPRREHTPASKQTLRYLKSSRKDVARFKKVFPGRTL